VLGLPAASGALHVLALPPFDAGWLAWVALVPWLAGLRLEPQPGRRLVASAVFGLVSVVGVVHWLPRALVVGNGFPPLAAALLSAGVFAWYAAWFAALPLAVAIADRHGWTRPWARACLPALAWGAMEAVRDGLLPAVAWTRLGYSQHATPPVLQLAAWVGPGGLSMIVVFVNGLVGEALVGHRDVARRARALAGALASVLLVLGAGWLLLGKAERPPGGAGREMDVAAVQIAVPQAERWQPEQAWPRIEALLAWTGRAARAGADLVVWPETAIEVHLDDAPGLSEAVARTLSPHPGAQLLAGVPREVGEGDGEPRFYNSAVLLDARGRQRGVYDKLRLYPISEYVPQWLLALPGARWLFASQLRWEPYSPGRPSGDAALLLSAPVPIGVLICAEGVTPGPARARARAGATLLVHMANDAVIPGRAAAAQHFAIARFRAVETRRPLVRASNLGVTAVIGSTGRVLARSAATRPGIALAPVRPRAALSPYVQGGWTLPWVALGVLVLFGLVPRRSR